MTLEKLPRLDDDGLEMPEVGPWSETKYRLIQNYASMFSTAMKGKWECRVYLDLFSGAGRVRIRETNRIVPGSPMLALDVPHPFDRYIFCEADRALADALRARVKRDYPEIPTHVIDGDCNQRVDEILRAIPIARRGHRVLSLCVVDPFGIGNLRFRTIESIAERFVDFLVLIPSGMDANRNQDRLQHSDSSSLDAFLGSSEWRERWAGGLQSGNAMSFGAFVVSEFGLAMGRLGYLDHKGGREIIVRHGGRALYHLALYSRSPLGGTFWTKAARSSQDQLGLPLE